MRAIIEILFFAAGGYAPKARHEVGHQRHRLAQIVRSEAAGGTLI